MSLLEPLIYVDRGEPIEQLVYRDGVTAAEVLADLLRIQSADGTVWEGRIEDPGGET